MLVVETKTVQSVWLCEEEKDKVRKGFTMRKTLLVITVLFVTAQAYAGSVTLTVTDKGDGWAAIGYSADANVSGFGLKVTADSGALFTDVKDYNVGESTAGNLGYGIFPDNFSLYIDVNDTTGEVDDWSDSNYTPVAPNDAPGAASSGFGTGTLVLEMGALYEEPNRPALSGTLILVKVDDDCNVCVEGESVRGNVVFTDATSVDPNACGSIVVVTDCFPIGHPDYAAWDEVGKPDCWCYEFQCRGDANGKTEFAGAVRVLTVDLDILVSAYGQPIEAMTSSMACADFDHAGEFGNSVRVLTNDLAALIASYGQPTANVPSCPMDWDGDSIDDYNFWITP